MIRIDTISEVDGLPLVTIPRADIQSVELTHGLLTERPWSTIAAGLAVFAIGVAGIRILVDAFETAGHFPKTGALTSLCAFWGPLLVYSAFRRGPILRIKTCRGVRTLQFGKTLDPDTLPQFVERARAAGLHITSPETEDRSPLPRARARPSRKTRSGARAR